MTRVLIPFLFCAVVLSAAADPGREFFVAPTGDDAAEGLSRGTAFRTVGHGASGLTPGDTLTVLPGEYFEAVDFRTSGRPGAPITLRAERPGTAWIRGDVDLHGFEKVPGTRYTYAVHVGREVEGVAERSTLLQYVFVPSVLEVDDTRCAFYYDAASGLLYVRTSDGRSPGAHALSVSVTNGFGLILRAAEGETGIRDIVIDGLVFSGYQARDIAPLPGFRTRWGLYLVEPERVTVRRCTVFFNGGGAGRKRPFCRSGLAGCGTTGPAAHGNDSLAGDGNAPDGRGDPSAGLCRLLRRPGCAGGRRAAVRARSGSLLIREAPAFS